MNVGTLPSPILAYSRLYYMRVCVCVCVYKDCSGFVCPQIAKHCFSWLISTAGLDTISLLIIFSFCVKKTLYFIIIIIIIIIIGKDK